MAELLGKATLRQDGPARQQRRDEEAVPAEQGYDLAALAEIRSSELDAARRLADRRVQEAQEVLAARRLVSEAQEARRRGMGRNVPR